MHAKAWTLTEDRPIEDATIVIANGSIVSMTSAGTPPADARVIDAQGRVVTPGIINAATQLGLIEVNAASDTIDHSAKPGGPGAAFDIQYAINSNSGLIRLARADGLARAITYPGSGGVAPFGGVGALLHLVEHGDVLEQPRVGLFISIGSRVAPSSLGSRAAEWQALRTALDGAIAAAAKPAVTGAPATGVPVKPVAKVTPSPLDLVLSGKIPLAITTHRESDLRQAAKLAREYGIRIVIIGGAEAWRVATELAAAKVAVVLDPTANLPYSFDQLGSRLDNAALLRKAGVVIAVSLDGVQSYNPGSSVREGAGLAVANGLPYIEGLRSIISAPAQIWGVNDRSGTLAPGKDGDIVIWDGDPLEPSSLPTTVLIRGQSVSQLTHQSELRDRYLPQIRAAAGATRVQP
ncbi:MAG: amidohydrolase family protein [Steroidobacter sp.]|nr:amidohydrolase family protein [Steroidobacter sp.]